MDFPRFFGYSRFKRIRDTREKSNSVVISFWKIYDISDTPWPIYPENLDHGKKMIFPRDFRSWIHVTRLIDRAHARYLNYQEKERKKKKEEEKNESSHDTNDALGVAVFFK